MTESRTIRDLFYRGYPFIILVAFFFISWIVLTMSQFMTSEQSRFLELAIDAETWQEVEFYSNWAIHYGNQSNILYLFSVTLLATGVTLSLSQMTSQRSSRKLDTMIELLNGIGYSLQ